jgi:sulfur relay (sulfurtransferase) DsrF/TusC family protein
MQSILFILNEAPDGSERVYNGLRVAAALRKAIQIRVFPVVF